MKATLRLLLYFCLLLNAVGCNKKAAVEPIGQTCNDAHTLETYQGREAMVIQAIDQYWLTVAPEDLQRGSYNIANVLVPTTPLPDALKVNGLRVRVSGNKKSCYGLVTLPGLRTSFGYKFELKNIEP